MEKHWIAADWGTPENWRLVEYDVPAPGHAEITVRVHAAGMNPADRKHVASPIAGVDLPTPIGYEISGVVTAVGPDTVIGSGAVEPGDKVLAFRVSGGYASEVTIPAEKAFHKPERLSHPEAANLLLVGTTAAEMLAVVGATGGETILLHGASGAVGVSVLQQAALRGIRVIGTASRDRFDEVERFGGIPVTYGEGLAERVRAAAPGGIAAALDAVGTDEAVDVSQELVSDGNRIITIAAKRRAERDGIRWIAGSLPDSARFRDGIRSELIDLAGRGDLEVPVARTFALDEAIEATEFLAQGHPGGKLALIP